MKVFHHVTDEHENLIPVDNIIMATWIKETGHIKVLMKDQIQVTLGPRSWDKKNERAYSHLEQLLKGPLF